MSKFYLLAGVSGGAGHSVTVDYGLLSHVEPHSLCCLLTRTPGHFLQNLSESLGCWLSTAKNWEPSNLTCLVILELLQSFTDLSEIWSTHYTVFLSLHLYPFKMIHFNFVSLRAIFSG